MLPIHFLKTCWEIRTSSRQISKNRKCAAAQNILKIGSISLYDWKTIVKKQDRRREEFSSERGIFLYSLNGVIESFVLVFHYITICLPIYFPRLPVQKLSLPVIFNFYLFGILRYFKTIVTR